MSDPITFEAADIRFLASSVVVLVLSAIPGKVTWSAAIVATLVSFIGFSHLFTGSLLGAPGFSVACFPESRAADV